MDTVLPHPHRQDPRPRCHCRPGCELKFKDNIAAGAPDKGLLHGCRAGVCWGRAWGRLTATCGAGSRPRVALLTARNDASLGSPSGHRPALLGSPFPRPLPRKEGSLGLREQPRAVIAGAEGGGDKA